MVPTNPDPGWPPPGRHGWGRSSATYAPSTTDRGATRSLILAGVALLICGILLGPAAIAEGIRARRRIAAVRRRPRAADGGPSRPSWWASIATLAVVPGRDADGAGLDLARRPDPRRRSRRAPTSVDEAQAARGHRRLDVGQVDHELGEVGREHVLAHEHRRAVDRLGDALAAQHGRARPGSPSSSASWARRPPPPRSSAPRRPARRR